MLTTSWPMLRDAAGRRGLGSMWLLDQPDEKQVAILTTGRSALADVDVEALRASVDALALMPSFGLLLPVRLGLTRLFDRTSPIFSTWLPLSRQRGGAPVANPSSPPWPLPTVAPQEAEAPVVPGRP